MADDEAQKSRMSVYRSCKLRIRSHVRRLTLGFYLPGTTLYKVEMQIKGV